MQFNLQNSFKYNFLQNYDKLYRKTILNNKNYKWR